LEERHSIAKGLGRGRHKTYHPKASNLDDRTYKEKFNIEVSSVCKNCGSVFHRRIDTREHFNILLKKHGWLSIIFAKPDDTVEVFGTVPAIKNIDGQIACPKCRAAIDKFWSEYKEKKAFIGA
jgi:uncharacterized C2H2 Zn-finger protein